ncbi:TonB-dependent receptor [Longimicrobium terrae]|uniref:Iron complex outermembrane receptor protein n=1 Tax=Longimicrobium terrae TaxID=1639882 RepID=A0A841GNC1_9BACT|nr:TonB-dependent receptor [Longimicrobium terrae]MBB4634720.1 iron complex outermembrane receptor protein [Longimicrobium terrae]MBB6068390.1 iron complex outermembrane receptor protein [Longimicrobium terrae]NNC32670.1 TonB-dependent receptor [Longimicrobium terrae]
MSHRFGRGALLALSALLVLSGAAHAAADPEVAPPITGVVRDTAGTPLANARVIINEVNRTAITGSDGTFTIRALRAGTYHLDATLLGYAPGHAVVTVPESGPDVRVVITMRSTVLSLEGINVTASARSADPLNITQSTVELSGKALDRSVGTSVAQTLSTQPGLSVRYGGPAASTPVIRGLAGERVLVVQNGQRTGDLSSTSADHALSIDPLAASRIEVVRGPASLLYGNNALGGVVNVIASDIPTTIPGRTSGFLALQGESVNPGAALTGELTAPVSSTLAVTARAGGRNVDDTRVGGGGVLDNTFYRNLYGTAGLGYVTERVQGGVSLGGYTFKYGLPSLPGAEESGVSIDGDRFEGTGRLDVAMGRSGFTNLRVDGSAQRYGHDEIESGGEIGTRFRLDTQTGSVTARTAFGRLTGALGVSGLRKDYSPEGEEALTPAASSLNGGAFLYQELALSGSRTGPSLQAGARFDAYSVRPDETDDARFAGARDRDFNNFSGSLGLNVPLNDHLSASVSVARSFRAPTVEELYSNAFHAAVGTYDIGNPELALETNRGAEAVVRAQSERVNAQFSTFYNRIDNYITADIAGDTTIVGEEDDEVTVPLNIFRQADAQLRGVEGQIEVVALPHVVVGVMGDMVRGDFVDGGALPFMPAARVGGSVRWDDGKYSVSLDGRHAFEQDRTDLVEFRTDAYTLLNLSTGVSLRQGSRIHSIVLRADNLLDEAYREPTSRLLVPSPGRNLSLVYRVLF